MKKIFLTFLIFIAFKSVQAMDPSMLEKSIYKINKTIDYCFLEDPLLTLKIILNIYNGYLLLKPTIRKWMINRELQQNLLKLQKEFLLTCQMLSKLHLKTNIPEDISDKIKKEIIFNDFFKNKVKYISKAIDAQELIYKPNTFGGSRFRNFTTHDKFLCFLGSSNLLILILMSRIANNLSSYINDPLISNDYKNKLYIEKKFFTYIRYIFSSIYIYCDFEIHSRLKEIVN